MSGNALAVVILYFAVLSFACLLAAQPYARALRTDSYDTAKFFARLREDRGIRNGLIHAWLASASVQVGFALLFIIILSVASILNPILAGERTNADEILVVVMGTALLSFVLFGLVFSATMVIYYLRSRKRNAGEGMRATARGARLNAALSVLILAAAVAAVLCVYAAARYLLYPPFAHFLLAAQDGTDANSAAWWGLALLVAALTICNASAQYALCALLPRLLALAGFVLRPLERALAGRTAGKSGPAPE
jgi:hypothetical protein